MAAKTLRPPNFSEDVAWVPCWLQNLRTNGSNEYVKESQAPSNQAEKDLSPSKENGIAVKNFNALSREDGGYRSCHLFLSGDDSSLASVAPSPPNVFHFSLHLSSDIDSPFFPTQDLSQPHHLVAQSKAMSLQPAQTSADFRADMHSMIDHRACQQDVSAAFIHKTVTKDVLKSLGDTVDSVRQPKKNSKVKCCRSTDISDAVELSIAASEALAIHDLVNMGSVSETLRKEDVLEVALRVKQARLQKMEDGFHSSSEESDCSDSLSDLNDFLMEDVYEDIGLSIGISVENNICNSDIYQAKSVSGAENYNECNNKHSDRELTSPLANFDDKSQQKQLEANVEMEVQQNPDSPLDSISGEREMHSGDPDLGGNTPKCLANGLPVSLCEDNTDFLALSQGECLAKVDLISIKPQNSVDSSLVQTSENFKNENWQTYLAPERFKSRWLGGWTSKELDSSSLNGNNAGCISKFYVRETSFLTESVDIIPDESSCVLKHDPKCAISSQLSIPFEGLHNKPDEGVFHSQDLVSCSSLSSIDPLCSFVPCSIASEQDNYKTHIGQENDTKSFVPPVSDFEVDISQRISENATFDCRNEKIMPTLNGKDIPITATKVVEEMSEKITRVEHTCLKTYSTILPNQAVNLNCNLRPLPTNQSINDPAAESLGTRVSEPLSASKHADENKNEENHQHLVDQKSIIEIAEDKSDAITAADLAQERCSPLVLNQRKRLRLLGPKTAINDISVENNIKRHVVLETDVQDQQNDNLDKLQVDCNKFRGGHVKVKKQVRFLEKVEEIQQKRNLSMLESSHKRCSTNRAKRQRVSKSLTTYVPRMKHSLTNYCRSVVNEFIFRGTEFLITGLSSQKERDLEALIRNSGGVILSHIPPPPNSRRKRSSALSSIQLPVILCKRKLQNTKFLYGCAVGASILKVDWITDCLASGTILHPEKYMILPNRNDMKWSGNGMAVNRRIQKNIFERVGIMLHGKHTFCTKFACIIKHGGGQVFKTLQWLVRSNDEGRTLVAAIVVEDRTTISRHLKSCALERDIPIMSSIWIIKSLYSGKLLPFTEENDTPSLPSVKVPEVRIRSSVDMSEEI